MDEPERKRGGPLTWLRGRSRRFWIDVAIAMPVLYVVSICPGQAILNRTPLTTQVRECWDVYCIPIQLVMGWSQPVSLGIDNYCRFCGGVADRVKPPEAEFPNARRPHSVRPRHSVPQ